MAGSIPGHFFMSSIDAGAGGQARPQSDQSPSAFFTPAP